MAVDPPVSCDLVHGGGFASVPDSFTVAEKTVSCGPHNGSGHTNVPLPRPRRRTCRRPGLVPQNTGGSLGLILWSYPRQPPCQRLRSSVSMPWSRYLVWDGRRPCWHPAALSVTTALLTDPTTSFEMAVLRRHPAFSRAASTTGTTSATSTKTTSRSSTSRHQSAREETEENKKH